MSSHVNDPETQAVVAAQWHLIAPGDRVTIRTPHGQELTGRVVMKLPTHAVLNGGGKHGKPLVADPRNFVRHAKSRARQ